jgi:hypothetical protein
MPQSIRNESSPFQHSRKCLQYALGSVQHVTGNQSQNDPISIPIVAFPKTSPRHQNLPSISLLQKSGTFALASAHFFGIRKDHLLAQLVPSLVQILCEFLQFWIFNFR